MTRIFVEDTFDAAHFLPNVPASHKCHNLHGHTYKIRLELEGLVGLESGWVKDYSEIKDQWGVVKDMLDHRNLNQLPGLNNSTCELLAEWIWDRLKYTMIGLKRIELRETEKCGVIYEG